MSTVLYQIAVDLDGNGKECSFVDGNGKMWKLPFDEPTEFQNEYMASKIVEHCHYYGIVEVHSTRDRAGVHYDMEDAKKRAKQSIQISMKACINDYVKTQLEDRVRKNFPPLPPEGRALESCIVMKYNLLKSGIRCVGWEPPYAMEDPGFGNTISAMPEGNAMQQQINQLTAQLASQNDLIMKLLTGQLVVPGQAGQGKVRGKKVTTEVATQPPVEPESLEPVNEPTDATNEPEHEPTDEYEQDQSANTPSTGIRL